MNKIGTKTTIILALTALLALCACSREPALPESAAPGVIRLKLGTESPSTRVVFEDDVTFKWSEGDKVGAYMYSTTLPNTGIGNGTYGPWIAPFTLASGAGTGSGEFVFDITWPENGETVGHVAMYPYTTHEVDGPWEYQSRFDETNSTLVFNLPDKWKDLPNLEGVRIPMAANLDSKERPVIFRHVGGAVKVTLKNVPAGARYFKLSADKNLSGEFVIRQDEIGTGTLRGDGSNNYVELQLAEGAGKALESVDVYFPVPAGTYTFNLGVYGDGVTYYEKWGSHSNTIGRGNILRLPAIDLNGSGGGDNPNPNPGGNTGIGEYDPNLAAIDRKSGLIYQINVYSFADSDGDGYGDFQGITDHLDYLESLGVTALWLSPIHPAQSYHGYDIIDYEDVNPRFGKKKDFRNLVKAAHARNIRIYLDYVINHSGNGHPWFKDCVSNGTDSPYWGLYSFSKDPLTDCYAGAIDQIPQGWYDTGKWFPVTITSTGETYYYYSQFNTGMLPDYNYWHGWNCNESPAFQNVVDAISTWLALGVDGLRLDAVKHIYADESSYENVQFWQKFYSAVNNFYHAYAEEDSRTNLIGTSSPDIFMVGECLSGEDVCLPYYEGLPSVFDFQFWWTLREALNNESSYGVSGGMCDRYYAHLNKRADAVYVPILSNHDDNRTAHQLGGYMPKIRLACTMLLTAPGRPVIYQGEELGYWGTKGEGDEYVRTPILWTPDLTSAAISGVDGKIDAEMLQAPIDVQSQTADESSLLNLYRRFAYARNINPALADGHPEYDNKTDGNGAVSCWYLHANDGSGKSVLVMHNLSRYTQTVERWEGDNLSNCLVASENMTVSGHSVIMPPYSSIVFALN